MTPEQEKELKDLKHALHVVESNPYDPYDSKVLSMANKYAELYPVLCAFWLACEDKDLRSKNIAEEKLYEAINEIEQHE